MEKYSIDKNYIKEKLTDLVSIYSVTGSEEQVARYITHELMVIGVENVELMHVEGEMFNVTGSISGGESGPTVLFTGHMDTVPAGEGWLTDPFRAYIDGDRLYGRGALDMKSGIAAVLGAVKAVAKEKETLRGTIRIAFVSDEEATSKGVNKLIDSGLAADFGIAAEPENNPMIVGAVGKMLIKVTAKGVAAHGSQPKKGVNAVEEMSRFISELPNATIPTHPEIPSQPYVTLKIEGGFKEYSIVVPESCTALINKHTVPSETSEYVLEQLQTIVDKINSKANFSFEIMDPYYPAFDLGNDVPFMDKLKKIFNSVTGEELKTGYCTGVSDNNRIVPLTGIPVVCLGAKGDGLHSKNEWVSLESVYQISEVYYRLVED